MGKANWNVMNSLVPRLFFRSMCENSLGTRLDGEDLKMRLWFLATYTASDQKLEAGNAWESG